jgi:hypothetical protein
MNAEPDQETNAVEIVAVYEGDRGWGVRSILSSAHNHRESPCTRPADGTPTCPWAVDAPVGYFPPEVFKHSARTAYDRADTQFGCHTASQEKPATCAGFLLRGAQHNIAARMYEFRHGPRNPPVHDGGLDLYPDYRAMAIANGVDPDDPSLAGCRGNDYGDDIDPREHPGPYTHWALFTSKPKAQECEAELARNGYTVRVDAVEDVIQQKLADTDEERWLLRASKPVTLNDLIDRHSEVQMIVERHGGRYDGGEHKGTPAK